MSDPIHSFAEAMTAAGLQPASVSDIQATGKFIAIKLADDKPKKKTGFYRLTIVSQDFAVGNFGSHRIGETHTWHSKQNGRVYSDEEKADWKAKIEATNKAREEERLTTEVKAAKAAKLIWDGAEYAKPDHTYLTKKRIKAHNFKQHEGKLLIPMWADKKFQAYQTIDEDGDKLYLPGARKKGCYCPLMEKGESLDFILFATGVATGSTVREVTGLPTIICFDDGNIWPVVEDFRKRYPQSKFVIVADNDAWQKLKPTDPERVFVGEKHEKNSGLRKSEQAAVKAGYARVIWPQFEPEDHPDRPTDFNDAFVVRGEDYVRTRIDEALSAPMPEPPKPKPPAIKRTPPEHAEWEQQLIFRDKEGVKLAENSINYKLMICNHPMLRHVFAYDEFHLCTMVVAPGPWAMKDQPFVVHPLSETDIRNTDYFLQKVRDLKGSKEKTLDAIEECGLINSFHPARDHLLSLVWDGTPRLDNWLITYVRGKDDPAYLRAIGSKWLIAGVKRLMEPGCQFDNMLIIEGDQDAGKSRTFRTLSRFGPPDSYTEYFMDGLNISNAEETDELMKLAGVVIVEVQEMAGFRKKEDDLIKRFISNREDTYRAPYARRPQKWPRQFILGGTYNPNGGIFKDPTGLKRFWPMEAGVVDLDGLERDREQLWAEAVSRYKQGESLVLSIDMKKMASEAAETRRIIDDATQDVVEAVRGWKFFETRQVLKAMNINFAPGKSTSESRAIGDILRTQGYRRLRKRVGSKIIWGWEPPFGTHIQEDLYEQEEETEVIF